MRGAGRGRGDFFGKIPRRGGVSQVGGGGEARGREVVCGEFEGGGLIFFFGAKMSTKSWIERAQKPKTYCDNSSLRSYLSPLVFIVRSGPVWRQDLAILSPEGPRDNTCQLRARKENLQRQP